MPPGPPSSDAHNALGIGQRLNEFEIRGVVGVGGFGIVYLAYDHALLREVALKEYMPAALAGRSATLHVSVLSQSQSETFALGLRSFVNEARMLARFDHPGLVKVHRFWEGNGTAYMVMPLLKGRTLRDLRQAMATPPDEAWLRRLLDPLLGALEVLHKDDVYHRDIAPDNIHVNDNGAPMLLDFGAARHVISDRSQALTAILKPSYAPIEQYGEVPGLRQGPWTDLYALGATMHYLIVGSPPMPATARALSDGATSLTAKPHPGITESFLHLVEWMLAPRPADRPQSVAELRDALAGQVTVPVRVAAAPAASNWTRTEMRTVAPPVDADATVINRAAPGPEADLPLPLAANTAAPAPVAVPRRSSSGVWVASGAAVLLGGAALAWMLGRSSAPAPAPAPAVAASSPAGGQPLAATRPSDMAASAMPGPASPEPAATSKPAVTATAAVAGLATPAGAGAAAVAASAVRREPPSRPAAASAPRPPQVKPAVAAAPTAQTNSYAEPPKVVQAAPPPVYTPAPTAQPSAGVAVSPVPSSQGPRDPREQCGGRVFIALHMCLQRECVKPEFFAHKACVNTRRLDENNRRHEPQ